MKHTTTTFPSILFVALAFWVTAIDIHKLYAQDAAQNNLRAAMPAYAAKVEKTVATLQAESSEESVSNLYIVRDFFFSWRATGIYY